MADAPRAQQGGLESTKAHTSDVTDDDLMRQLANLKS